MTRHARTDEANILTDISFRSENYWNYPQEYLEVWKKELTITEEYIEGNDVYVYEHNEKMGCRYIKEYPSTIQNRTIPYLEYEL